MTLPLTHRRDFLARCAAGAAGGALLYLPGRGALAADADKPVRVAAILTTFFFRSHAHVILENFVQPYLFNGQATEPGMEVVSMFVDQIGENDMSRGVAKQFDIPMFGTIEEALTCGGDELAVDAVLSIGEHGNYPTNAKGQVEYPRKEFFDQIVAVFKKSGRGVPVFNDKHLSYRWDWAKEMVDTSKAMGFPLMAGSSVPLAQRRPVLELPGDAKIEEAVSIHGGGVESYDFHALEVLQSQVEARAGGETGVERVQFLEAEPLWKAAAEGQWSPDLGAAAMAAELGADHDYTRYVASGGKAEVDDKPQVHGILVHYKDGTRGLALKVGNSGIRWNFACRLAGQKKPLATAYYVGPWQNRNLFKALSHAIQTHFRQKQAPYPVERTLLVSGILDAAMDSRLAGGKLLDTPQLEDVAYAPRDFRDMREMGCTWKIITDETPEPAGIEPVAIPDAG
ncbi:MAG: hypothetical protein DWQ37_11005 [Planctomycetota bacterium]|mgnify:CR=1 FL=1|nr:MAG: hypothetical protein DWQ37_11005 [Planctomycetota bacterium]